MSLHQEEARKVPSQKRLANVVKRISSDPANASNTLENESKPEPAQTETKRPKLGLKLKIKFNGAILSSKPAEPSSQSKQVAVQELDLLGLPEDDWLKPAPAKWRRLRQKPHTSIDAELPEMELPTTDKAVLDDSPPALAINDQQHPIATELGTKARSTAYQEKPATTLVEGLEKTAVGRGGPETVTVQPEAVIAPQQGIIAEANQSAETALAGGKETKEVNVSLEGPAAERPVNQSDVPPSSLGASTGLQLPEKEAQTAVGLQDAKVATAVPSDCKAGHESSVVVPKKEVKVPAKVNTLKRKAMDREEGQGTKDLQLKESGELAGKGEQASKKHCGPERHTAPTAEEMASGGLPAEKPVQSHSQSHSSSSSTDSDSDSRENSSGSRRARSRSREAGERSDSDHLRSRPYSTAQSPRSRSRFERSRSRSPHHDRPRFDGSRSRSWAEVRDPGSRQRQLEREKERDREEYARHRRRLEERRQYERSRSERDGRYSRYESREDYYRDRRGSHRGGSIHSDDRRDRRSPEQERAVNFSVPARSRRRGDALETKRSASLLRVRESSVKAEAPAAPPKDALPAGQPPLPPDEPAAAPIPIGFADAWNMLHGSAKADWGTEADIDQLHNSATIAKRNIDNISKATNGKHTFENLVALLRDSYLKYMQVGAIWEAIARQPNPPANRNRAKLADEGGMYPATIGLMRQIASECKTCPANTEASVLLRILAERLMAIMQMRVAQVQRAKVHQDRQLLLALPGAPKVDYFGRKLPGQENPGETYQRPSPTDSNASNNTSEQAVSLPPPASRPIPKSPASSSMNKAPLAPLGKPLAARGGKVTKGRELPAAAKANPSKRMRTTNPAPQTGRDDAWAVHPPAWEIPITRFESEMRSWSILGGVVSYTLQFRSHAVEIQKLMEFNSPLIKEAAGMLGFLDLGVGMSNIGVVMQLSQNVLDLILKIQQNGSNLMAPAVPVS